ncbi:SRPBCC family protein [Pseudonocardia sp. CA-142604]|uniref:SRPBCC family protein n=1 Tax=Pseudonocardia sp. CA-142604 TaxID=3240024 RepID=UPI003D8E7F2B
MELVNEFTVPATPADAWKLLTDVERIAPCLPGATVESQGGDTYTGTVSVKVGPIKVGYDGTVAFRELDPAALRMVLDARGKERTGKGSAAAAITVDLHDDGAGGTRVQVRTDLQITGKVAQFGRSAMADISARLIDQFAANLASLFIADPTKDPVGVLGASPAGPAAASTVGAATAGELDALALAGPLLRRTVAPALGFGVGVLLTWLVARLRVARTAALPAVQS